MTPVEISNTQTTTMPIFKPVRVRMPIVGDDMTIWPEPKETFWDWVAGFPFEIHPFAWDYLWISCDGRQVEIKPHYLESTWDTFWTDDQGVVTAHALGGLFPFTLGDEAELLKGIVATLKVLPDKVDASDPDVAQKIGLIYAMLDSIGAPVTPFVQPEISRLRGTLSETLWRFKLRRLKRPESSPSDPPP